MRSRNHRRMRRGARVTTTCLAAILMGGLLVGCGFTDATERNYTPANGANNNPADTEVAVLGAGIVSTEPGSGTLIAVISNKSPDGAIALTGVAGIEESTAVSAVEFAPQTAPPDSYVDLSDEGLVKMTGDFKAGGFVRLAFTFDNGDRVPINVPVVANAGEFAGLDGPAPADTQDPETPDPDTQDTGETEG